MADLIKIKDYSKESKISASKSSGPGGQNVNKLNTKVEIRFNINNSELLSDDDKSLVLNKLENKINKEGELIIVSQSERTQLKNKEKAIERLNILIAQAIKTKKKRKATKTPKSAIRKRLKEKKIISKKKDLRQRPKE